MNIRTSLYLFFIFSGILIPGCIDEDRDRCPARVEIRFEYTYNDAYTDRFAQEVEFLDLFIFDAGGEPVKELYVQRSALSGGNTLALSLQPGKYTIVAWGNLSDEEYEVARGLPLSQMEVELICDGNCDHQPDYSLFYGSTVVSVYNDRDTRSTVSLIRDTNDIHVLLEGSAIQSLIEQYGKDISKLPFRLMIEGTNAMMRFDNSLDSQNGLHDYLASYGIGEKQVTADFVVMRITSDSDLMVYLYRDDEIFWSSKLTELLVNGNGRYLTAEELDRFHEYTIRIRIDIQSDGTYAVTSIVVNGWDLVEHPGIGI